MYDKKMLLNGILGALIIFMPEIFFALSYGGIYVQTLPFLFNIFILMLTLIWFISMTRNEIIHMWFQ